MIIGVALQGIAVAFIFVPLLSEIIESVKEKENIPENMILNDKASAIFNSAYSLGGIIGPLVGGLLETFLGFRTTCDIMALVAVSFAFIYFFLNILPSWCISKKYIL
jgi:MFS family permease